MGWGRMKTDGAIPNDTTLQAMRHGSRALPDHVGDPHSGHFIEVRGLLIDSKFHYPTPQNTDGVDAAQTRTRSRASYMHARERANANFCLWPNNQPH